MIKQGENFYSINGVMDSAEKGLHFVANREGCLSALRQCAVLLPYGRPDKDMAFT